MALPLGPPKFLKFHGKRYDPSIEWNDEEELLQDPLNHAPYPSTKDLKVSSFCFLANLSIFAWYLRNLGWTLSFCCYLLLWEFLNVVCFGWKILCVGMLIWFFLGYFWIVELFEFVKFGQCWWFVNFHIACSFGHCWMNFDFLYFFILNGYEHYGDLMCRLG